MSSRVGAVFRVPLLLVMVPIRTVLALYSPFFSYARHCYRTTTKIKGYYPSLGERHRSGPQHPLPAVHAYACIIAEAANMYHDLEMNAMGCPPSSKVPPKHDNYGHQEERGVRCREGSPPHPGFM
ncbi:hypothetical protein B0O80DRAFT_451315 [Mortierella sp. GBAus27b]|nr:hypothetical protein B0O80DRAFT_451315 [Mortierella sp. GBAus27b]